MSRNFIKVILLIMVVILIGVPSSTSSAAETRSAVAFTIGGGDDYSTSANRVNINPWKEADYYIDLNTQTGYTKFAWTACSKGLVNDAYDATILILTVRKNGKLKQRIAGTKAKNKWRNPVTTLHPKVDVSDCAWPAVSLWKRDWVHNNYPFANPGNYKVRLIWKFSEPIIDGGTINAPPALDVYDGKIIDETTTVHVSN